MGHEKDGQKNKDVFIERRRYHRLKKNLKVHFKTMDLTGLYVEGDTEDVSPIGFCINFEAPDTPPPAGKSIEITFDSPSGLKAPIQAMGRIAWVRKNESGKGFVTGFEITSIKKEDFLRFKLFLGEELKRTNSKAA